MALGVWGVAEAGSSKVGWMQAGTSGHRVEEAAALALPTLPGPKSPGGGDGPPGGDLPGRWVIQGD